MSAWFDEEDSQRNRTRYWCHVSPNWQNRHFVQIDAENAESDLARVLRIGLKLARGWTFSLSNRKFDGDFVVNRAPLSVPASTQLGQ
jgi:hypothetical protein